MARSFSFGDIIVIDKSVGTVTSVLQLRPSRRLIKVRL